MRSGASAAPDKTEIREPGDSFAQHFIKTLHRKLHDPSLLQCCPPPSPEVFKHNDKNVLPAESAYLSAAASLDAKLDGHPDAWGSLRHPFVAPAGSYKLLSSDYAWLDAPRSQHRRDANSVASSGAKPEGDTMDGGALLPEPPLAMQQTRFFANARLVLIKLRQQLEEVCVAAVRKMEAAATPPALVGESVAPPLSNMASFSGSMATRLLAGNHSFTAASVGGFSFGPGSLIGAGPPVAGPGGRLPPGFADELAENVRATLCAAFEDCLSDVMDQLWGTLQYAGSKHALVERMAEAMREREAELEATAAKYREEAASRLRSLRRQKEEIEAAAEKDRLELKALASAANSRVEVLEREMGALRTSMESERNHNSTKLDSQRASLEAALAAKDEAIEALRADNAARLEELRVLNAGLQQQLTQRQDEVARLSARATDQADMLALAFARRDGTYKELEVLAGQLDDFKRFVQLAAPQPLTDWLRTLKERDLPLTPLIGGPLAMEYGTGRAFMAAARNHGLHAVLEELRRLLPQELPWPEDGWPPDGQDDLIYEDEAAGSSGRSRTPSPTLDKSFPATLPATWHRFMRAPLGCILTPQQLFSHLAELAGAKWEADKAARQQGQAVPDLHNFIYKRAIAEHSSSVDADEAVTCLVQSLRAHSKLLPRAATWMQLLQLSNPVLPLDACTYYLEAFHTLIAPSGRSLTINVVDKAACTVWVPPTRWKTLLTGPMCAVFDTARKVTLLKQAATIRVDTSRGSKTFGMSDGDALLGVIMTTWLAERQAAVTDLATAWTAAEPVGGGALAINMDVDRLAKVAASALGPGVLPQDRPALLDLYFNTVIIARKAQAAARVRWSGITIASLAAALAESDLLPPRPLTPRGTQGGTQLAAAAGLLLRVAEAEAEEMRSQAAFRQGKAFEALDARLARAREAVQQSGEAGGEAERAMMLQAGWGALEELCGALLAAQAAYRGFELSLRDQMIRMSVDSALARAGSDASRPGVGASRLSSTRSRVSRAQRASNMGTAPDGGAAAVTQPSGDSNGAAGGFSRAPSHRLSGGGAVGSLTAMAIRPASRLLNPQPPSGRFGGGGSSLSRDLRAALSSARWSHAEDEEQQPPRAAAAASDDVTAPLPLLKLHSRALRKQLTPEAAASVASIAALAGAAAPASPADAAVAAAGSGGRGSGDAGGFTPAAATAARGEFLDVGSSGEEEEEEGEGPFGEGAEPEADAPVAARLVSLKGKYGRLRSRFGETVRVLEAAYSSAASGGEGGTGLPSPEVMAQLSPASKLRLVAELLAELHQEVERGVWPHLDTTVMEAIARPGSASWHGGRPVSAMPAMRMTVRPFSAVAPRPAARPATASSTVSAGSGRPPLATAEDGAWTGGGGVTSGGEEGPEEEDDEEEEGSGHVAQEVAGRLHAHAGHVGQVMMAAALETAALAAALEDLSDWGSHASSVQRQRAGAPMTSPRAAPGDVNAFAVAANRVSGVGSYSGSIGGSAGGDGSWGMASWRASRSSTVGGSGFEAHRLFPSHPGVVPFGHAYGSLPVGPPPLAGMYMTPGGGPTLTTFSASASGSGGVSGADAAGSVHSAAGASTAAPSDPWDGVPYDADPRDTVYLDALRALHLAADAQADDDGDVTALVTAVRQLVRLMGGQPQVTDDGHVIEFYPRRVPKDWRHPVLRSSLTRLYIYVCGALLQQQQRSALLREASADLAQRHAALAQAAADLESKAAGLRGLHASLGAQLAVMAAWVTQGSALMETLVQLGAAGEELRARVIRAQPLERGPSTPRMLSGGGATPAVRAPPAGAMATSQPSSSSVAARSNTSGMSRPGLLQKGPAAIASAAGAMGMRPSVGSELAAVAAAAAAAAAAAVAMASPGQPPGGEGCGGGSGGGTLSGSISPSGRGARSPSNVMVFSLKEWEAVRGLAGGLAAAVARVREAAGKLAALAQSGTQAVQGVVPAQVSDRPNASLASSLKVPFTPPALPSGDRILVVQVHVAAPKPTIDAGSSNAPSDAMSPTGAGVVVTGDSAAAGSGGTDSAAEATTNKNAAADDRPSSICPPGPVVVSPGEDVSFMVELEPPPLPNTSSLTRRPLNATATATATATGPGPSPPGQGPAAADASNSANANANANASANSNAKAAGGDAGAADSSDSGSGGDDAGGSERPPALAASPAGGGRLQQFPDVATPAVSPEPSTAAVPSSAAQPRGFSVHMALRRAHAAVTGGAGADDPSALPPGEALIHLSNTMLRRSAMAAMRRQMGAGAGGMGRAAARPAATAKAGEGPGPTPAHRERRPMTARAFVEGVMVQARKQQLERLCGAAGSMPRGALPEVDGLARSDDMEAALLKQHTLWLAGPHPYPTTALEVLVWQHREEAAAASAAANSAVADAVSAAAAAAAVVSEPASSSRGPAGEGAPGRRPQWSSMTPNGRPMSPPRLQGPGRLAARPPSAGGGGGAGGVGGSGGGGSVAVHSRLTAGVTGTKLATLPPMGPAAASSAAFSGSEELLSPRGAHLGYYPGLQVDAAGRLMDWRLPILSSFPTQAPLHRMLPQERTTMQQ